MIIPHSGHDLQWELSKILAWQHRFYKFDTLRFCSNLWGWKVHLLLQKSIQNDFTYWKMSVKASCNPKKWFWMNFDKKDAHVAKFDDFSQIATMIDILPLLKSKYTKDLCESTPKSYICFVLSIDCWKYQKIGTKMDL